MIWGILFIVLVVVLLPILIMAGTLEFLFNPVFGIAFLVCLTAIIIAKIIKS